MFAYRALSVTLFVTLVSLQALAIGVKVPQQARDVADGSPLGPNSLQVSGSPCTGRVCPGG